MDAAGFLAWLHRRKPIGHKTAKDTVSRCKRVESIFDMSLESTVNSDDKLEKVCQRIRNEVGSYSRPGVKQKHLWTSLNLATRLYAEYISR